MQSKFCIRYASDHHALLSALFYIEDGSDLYCWHAQLCDHNLIAAFYAIEDFYEEQTCVLHRSLEDDVHGPWVTLAADSTLLGVRCPVPEALRHELERLQSRFVEEWLFFENDPASRPACRAYETQQLPLHAVNINLKKLARMACADRVWQHHNAGFDENVLELVQKFSRHPVGIQQDPDNPSVQQS